MDDASDALGVEAPAASDRAALPVDEASVAELREGLSDAGDNLGDAAAALDDASADGPPDLTGSSGRLGSTDTLGDTPDLDTRLSGPGAPTTGDDLASAVGFDDPVAGDDQAEVTNSTLGGTSDPTGFGMGDTGSSTPSDLRQTDQSTMASDPFNPPQIDGDGGASEMYDRDRATVYADGVDQLDPAGGGSDATSGVTDEAANDFAYGGDAAGHVADQAYVVEETDEMTAVIQRAIRGDDPPPDDPPPDDPPPDDPPPDDPPPDDPPPDDPPPGHHTAGRGSNPVPEPTALPNVRMDPDADPVAPLQGREPAMGDVINLGQETEIDSPDSLKRGFVDEDELIRPTDYDEPLAGTNDFGRVDPGLYIEEGDGGDMGDMGDMEGP